MTPLCPWIWRTVQDERIISPSARQGVWRERQEPGWTTSSSATSSNPPCTPRWERIRPGAGKCLEDLAEELRRRAEFALSDWVNSRCSKGRFTTEAWSTQSGLSPKDQGDDDAGEEADENE